MKNPLLRGESAPSGYAHSVGSWLRAYAYREGNVGGLNIGQRRRLQLIDSCAGLPITVGDDDPRIRTLAVASNGSNRWEPTGQQLAAVQAAGHRVAGEPHELEPEDLLNAIAHGAMLDLATEHDRNMNRLRKAPDLPEAYGATLDYERGRADTAERRVREVEIEKATVTADNARLKTHLRELQAIVNGEPVAEKAGPVPKADRPLPEGIRAKGSGWQAYFKIGDRTSSRICPTVDEAVRWRTDAMARARGELAASDANLNPRTDPDLTSEQIAELREKAAA